MSLIAVEAWPDLLESGWSVHREEVRYTPCRVTRPVEEAPAAAPPRPPKKPCRTKTRTVAESQSAVLPQLVGAAVIAAAIGCTAKHVYALAATRRIPHTRIEGTVRFDIEKVRAWLKDHEITA